MLQITFIRHAESTDNCKSLWAGTKDAPLTNKGMNQARALGVSFTSTPLTAIYTSDLIRAHTTATLLCSAQPVPAPPIHVNLLLREQHFGVAEGRPYTRRRDLTRPLQTYYANGCFPELYTRDARFPEGESLNDVRRRAEEFIREVILPLVYEAGSEKDRTKHIAVVSHGIMIGELIPAMISLDESHNNVGGEFRGLRNTAWSRIEVLTIGNDATQSNTPPIRVNLTSKNRSDHLDNLPKEARGVGRLAHDPKQKDIRGFFAPRKGE